MTAAPDVHINLSGRCINLGYCCHLHTASNNAPLYWPRAQGSTHEDHVALF